jgi:epoxyqueuosine reductase
MSNTLRTIQRMLNKKSLDIVGSFNPDRSDNVCSQVRTILLVGPKEPLFWDVFKKSSEYRDNKENPLDRWSKKTIEKIAIKLNARSFFPFEAPFQPFIDWAKRCSTMGSSPVRLLVHKEKGLFISFRGALGINEYIEPPKNSKDICTPCEKPCLTACPVSALNQDGYDVVRCKDYLNTPSGRECRDGCLVRRSCPSGQNLRLKEQSNFHMRAFLSE